LDGPIESAHLEIIWENYLIETNISIKYNFSYHKSMVIHVQDQVLPHNSEPNDGNIGNGFGGGHSDVDLTAVRYFLNDRKILNMKN